MMRARPFIRQPCRVISLLSLSLLTLAPGAFGQTRAEDLFQQALRMERVSGDLEGAIRLYEQVVDTGDRAYGARALIRIAESYDKLGRQGAQDAYTRIIQDFGDQTEEVALARERLAAMEPPPAELEEVRITTRQIWSGLNAWAQAPTPDGKHLVWLDWQGSMDLAVREIATGENRMLTRQASMVPPVAFTYSGRVSPDGETVAYGLNDGEGSGGLHVIGMNGRDSRELYRELGCWVYPLVWTSDGHSLVAKRDCWSAAVPEGTFEILLFSVADGSFHVKNELLTQSNGHPAALSPDDRYLAYNFPVEEEGGNADIWILDLDGSGEGPLIRHPADDRLLGWLPGTNQVLFLSDRDGTRDLWAATVEQGLMQGPPRMIRRNVGQINPVGFSEDGSFFYSISTRWFSTSVAPFDLSTGTVDEGPTTALLGSNRGAAWSPDSEYLAFLTETGNPHSREASLQIRHLPTGQQRELVPHLSVRRMGGWSPDGRRVLVAGWDESLEDEEYQGSLYAVPVDGGQATVVLDYPEEVDWPTGISAVWARDGGSIYYLVKEARGGTGRIVWRDLASGEERELFRAPLEEAWPGSSLALSPDGDALAFFTRGPVPEDPVADPRRMDLMRLDLQDGSVRRLAELEFPGAVEGVQWTPDGKHLLWGHSRQGDEWGTDVFWMPISGGTPDHLWTFGEGKYSADFSLSPDGRRIALTTFAQEGEVWLMENLREVLVEDPVR
jgi:Tol biopolymer transport system component